MKLPRAVAASPRVVWPPVNETLHSDTMLTPQHTDALFREAVAAIDAGDVASLERMLEQTPALSTVRLEQPGSWLLTKFGGTMPDFFSRPYLLWFVAEDPVRNGSLPSNIADIARVIIRVAQRESPASLREQLNRCLQLIAWSWIARDSGVQIALIDALIDAGASPEGRPNDALVNKNLDAAAYLIERGAPLTLAAAACLNRWDDVVRIGATVNAAKKQFAFVLAALHGNAAALKALLEVGADVNLRCGDLYAHGTPLHHAVSSGSLDAVKLLVSHGANVNAVDTAWNGTPLGWAYYALEGDSAKTDDRAMREEIVKFLTPLADQH